MTVGGIEAVSVVDAEAPGVSDDVLDGVTDGDGWISAGALSVCTAPPVSTVVLMTSPLKLSTYSFAPAICAPSGCPTAVGAG